MNIVKTENLTKAFKNKEVVSNVSMTVKKGEIYGFLGPNGAGKTTIMKMLVNLLKPSGGEIELFGEVLNNKSYEVLKRIGSIIEYPVFYNKLTGRENLELHCEYMGYYKKGAVDEALEMVKLTGIESKLVKEYSLGMKQRLGLARAIITKPELLILDEPINGLDPIGIQEVRQLLIMLSKEHGITILISSHIISEIEQIADTIGVIDNGCLIEEISLDETKVELSGYVSIMVNDTKKASYILDYELKLKNFKISSEHEIRIYDLNISQSELTRTLIMNDIEVDGISKKESSLEEYFLSLLKEGEISA